MPCGDFLKLQLAALNFPAKPQKNVPKKVFETSRVQQPTLSESEASQPEETKKSGSPVR